MTANFIRFETPAFAMQGGLVFQQKVKSPQFIASTFSFYKFLIPCLRKQALLSSFRGV
jgi:hypothetical protein